MPEITLIDCDGMIAFANENISPIGARKTDEALLDQAARMPLSQWWAWRDENINRIFDSLVWFDSWNASDGEFVFSFRAEQFIFSKTGEDISVTRTFSDGRAPYVSKWRKGERCPIAWTQDELSEEWDRTVNDRRFMNILAEFIRINAGDPAKLLSSRDVAQFISAISKFHWRGALEYAKDTPEVYPVDYLKTLVEG